MEGNLFQQAKKQMMNMMSADKQQVTEEDKQLANHAIQAAYAQATPEEEQELQQLEEQLRQNQLL